jgi:signal transduction histidine kinase
MIRERRRAVAFFVILGICLVALAVALNVGWIIINLRQVALLVFGIIFFALIIAGLALNTTYLVREIRRNEQHDAFINAVSHELKTPIASLRLYLETLQTREVKEEKRREFYKVMLADTERLGQTVEQVLQAGQAGDKRWKLNKTVLDLPALARECMELARTRYKLDEDSLQFADSLAGQSGAVLGDPEQLRAAISNLLDNAVKYSLAPVRVTLEVKETDAKHLAIVVGDNGVGIARSELKTIFKRFYRASSRAVASIKGTGLGLFIVRSIAERHGGRVYAESAGEGRGSSFTMQLPKA